MPTVYLRKLPVYEPIERSIERIDGGFVLIGGWQIKYDPGVGHRRWIVSPEYKAQLKREAKERDEARREAAAEVLQSA